MDDRVWKNISVVLGVVCAVLIGIAGALMVVHKGGAAAPSTGPDSSLVATNASPTPTAPGTTPSNTVTQAPTPTQTPSGPFQQGIAGTITFNSMTLDGANDKSGNGRTFTFTSDGSGPVIATVTRASSGATIKMCEKVDSSAFACKVGSKPNFLQGHGDAGGHNTWTIVLYGYGTTTPNADISFTWPAVSHKITLTHGRFQGSSSPGVSEALNGFTATVKPSAAGALNVQASWTTITTDVEITLSDVTTPPAVAVDERLYTAVTFISPAYNFNVDPAKTYLLKLRDKSADSQRPDLTAQITFP